MTFPQNAVLLLLLWLLHLVKTLNDLDAVYTHRKSNPIAFGNKVVSINIGEKNPATNVYLVVFLEKDPATQICELKAYNLDAHSLDI